MATLIYIIYVSVAARKLVSEDRLYDTLACCQGVNQLNGDNLVVSSDNGGSVEDYDVVCLHAMVSG